MKLARALFFSLPFISILVHTNPIKGWDTLHDYVALDRFRLIKTVLCLSIAAFALVGLFVVSSDDTAETDGATAFGTNLTWEYSSGTLTIAVASGSDTGSMPDYTTSSAAPWYSDYKSSIKQVVINTGVSNIGNYAFYGLTALQSVTLSGTSTVIGTNAFDGCTKLTTITFSSNSVETIGDYAFRGCTAIKNITLYTGVTSIGSNAFRGCTSLETITIPSTVTTIGSSAFLDCTSLEEMTIPGNLTTVDSGTFMGCTSLTTISLPTSTTTISSNAFNGCTSLSTVVVPSAVTTIEDLAFAYCSSLSYVELPSSITSLNENAFYQISFMSGSTVLDVTTSNLVGKTWVGSGVDSKLYALGSGNTVVFSVSGTSGATTTSTKMTTVDGKLPSLPVASHATKAFDGWFTSSTGGTKITTSTTFSSSTTTVYGLFETAVAVTSVSISPTSADVSIGGTTTLTATVLPSSATDKTVTWTSSDTSVATVDDEGVVSGIKAGTATITVTTNDGSKTATSAITVKIIPVTKITLNKTEAAVGVSSNITLTATAEPTGATDKSVTWTSSDTSIATVNSSGKVTGVLFRSCNRVNELQQELISHRIRVEHINVGVCTYVWIQSESHTSHLALSSSKFVDYLQLGYALHASSALSAKLDLAPTA